MIQLVSVRQFDYSILVKVRQRNDELIHESITFHIHELIGIKIMRSQLKNKRGKFFSPPQSPGSKSQFATNELCWPLYIKKLKQSNLISTKVVQYFLINGQRYEFVSTFETSIIKIGRNNLINRLNILNGKIKYEWLNLSIDSFKIKCKQTFLTWTRPNSDC